MAIKRKLKTILTALIAAFVAVAATVSLTACSKKDDSSASGKEADKGVYYYAYDESIEYTITIESSYGVKWNFGDEKTGTYSLNGTALELTADGEKISATYLDGKITLTRDGKEMVFVKKITFVVSFEVSGGSAVTSQSVVNGKKANKPDAPVKEGYNFDGWYTDSACTAGNEYNFETSVTDNFTLYAKWNYIPVVNTVTYDNTDCTTQNTTAQVTEGESYTLEVPTVANGYVFIGWYTQSEGGVRLTDENGESLEVWNKTLGNITVYARIEAAYNYELNNDESGYVVSASAAIAEMETLTVPAYHNGKPVTEIGDFTAAAALKAINLPASLLKVEPSAFSNLKKLDSILVYDVEGLTANYKSADGILFSADGHTLVKYPLAKKDTSYVIPAAVIRIADQAFADIRETSSTYAYSFIGSLTEVTLPSNLKTIGNQAFFRRGNLRVVKFNDDKSNVDWTIGDGAFSDMYLQKFPFNNTLVSIGDSAFYYSWSYLFTGVRFEDEVVLSSRLKKIGDSAFENCSWLGSITIPASCEYLGAAAFSGTRTDEVIIEENSRLTEIADEVFSGCQFEEIFIPSTVTRIGDSAFEGCDCLTKITIPAGVTYIGSSAFEDCTEISELKLPSGLKTIGDSAFAAMESLASINIPNTVTSFGEGVFTGCESLELDNVGIEEGNTAIAIEDGVMYSADKKKLLYYPANRTSATFVMPDALESIPDEMFKNNAYLTSVTLSASLTKIPNGAFSGTKIVTITIPAAVTTIEAEAFRRSALTEVIFASGSNLTAIRESAFAYTSIRSITLPAKLAKLESDVFEYCSLLSSVTFTGNDLKTLSSGTFNGDAALKNITLSDGITEIASGAFQDCSAISQIVLPKNLVTLSTDAFGGVSRLQNISISDDNATFKSVNGALYSKDGKTLILYACEISGETDTTPFVAPEGLETIGEKAFYGRETLASVNLTGVKVIGDRAFASCKALTEVNLSGVETISDYAFSGCSALTDVDISSVTTLNAGAFNYCSSLVRVEYANIDYIPENAFGYCSALKSFDFAGIKNIGKDAFGGAGLTSIVLDNDLTVLGDGAFSGTKITQVVIPAGITELNGTFSGCYNLASVTLNNVTKLGNNAFYECVALRTIDLSKVVSIGNGAFKSCAKLESVTLGEVTDIAGYAFYNCTSLLSITLPASLENLADNAFSGASKLLEVINLSGLTVEKGKGVAANALVVKTSGTSDIADENGFKFLSADGKVYLIAYTGDETAVTLPASFNGKNYSIYNSAFQRSNFVSVSITGGVDEMGSNAFADSYQLTSVSISGVKETGVNAFYGCSKLVEVTIGDGVEKLSAGTFSGCTQLREVSLGKDLTEIGDKVFEKCYHLKTLTVPEKVATVSNSAFDNCQTLVEIINFGSADLSKHALTVKTTAGSDLVVENGFVFYTVGDKNYLVGYEGTDKDLNLPVSYNGGNYEIYKYAFYGMSLGAVTVNGGVTAFGESSFNSSEMTSLTIGDAVKGVIAKRAFYFNTSLTTVVIGNGITSIGEEAFSNSNNIKTVIIGNGVTEIAKEAFAYCNKLESVTIGENVRTIGGRAFYYSSLKDVVLPASLKTAATDIFDRCDSFKSLTVNSQEALDTILGSLKTFMKKAKVLKVKEGLTVDEAKLDEVGAAKIGTENGFVIYSR